MKTRRLELGGKRLSHSDLRELFERYRRANKAFLVGDFPRAAALLKQLVPPLKSEFARIVRENFGAIAVDDQGDLTDAEIEQMLDASAPDRARKLLRGGRDGKLATLCAAIAHDAALLARHLAEGAGKGRDPEVAKAIIASFAHSLAVHPFNSFNLHNLAGFEDYLGRDRDAALHYEAALRMNPRQRESWTSFGHTAARLGYRAKAEACWEAAVAIANEDPKPGWDMAMLRLLKGDYVRGWRDYEARLSFPPYLHGYGRRDLAKRRWDGEPEPDSTLILHGEQGAGDVLMMARYIPMVRERFRGKVIVEVIPGLKRLFDRTFPELEILARDVTVPKPDYDTQLPMFSLPAIFGTTLETVPPPIPFVAHLPMQGWLEMDVKYVPPGLLPERGRIGICWKGSTTHANDLTRSFPFEACFPLFDVPGTTWQSLQFGYEMLPPIDNCPAGDYADTADAIARCELVITADTSVAHLAASMGVETWILLPVHAEWRWLQDRQDSPWYPSARLLRCEKPRGWKALIAHVADELRERYSPNTEAA